MERQQCPCGYDAAWPTSAIRDQTSAPYAATCPNANTMRNSRHHAKLRRLPKLIISGVSANGDGKLHAHRFR